MKIAVSADCFSAFTSGFPVRGMMLELIRMRQNDKFVLFYTRRATPEALFDFYGEINNLPNVEVRYFKYSRKIVALRRMCSLPLTERLYGFDLFINPGNPEYWQNIHVPHICSIADFSTIKGLSTGKYAWFYKYFNRFAFRYMFAKIDVVVPVSRFTETDLHKFWPRYAHKTHVVLNGIDDMWFDRRADFFAIPQLDGAPYFIWWGLISRRKNIANLIEAYKKAKKEDPELPKLLLVGNTETYMEHIKDSFTNDIVNIPFQDGYVLKGLVRNSKGLLFPSFYEGFGLPVIEAFSQGVPVACSDVSSLPEIANGLALLFNPYDVKSIKRSILEMKNMKNGKEKRMAYASKYTYRAAAQQYSSIINKLVRQ